MKKVFTILAILIVALSFGQSKNLNGTITKSEIKTEVINVTVNVDSVEEIESTFTIDDIRSIFEETIKEGKVSFKIICIGKENSKSVKSSISYKVDGDTNNIEKFINNVKKIKETAINYYKTK